MLSRSAQSLVGRTQKGLNMNQSEITKLVTCIEENLRASPSSGLPFVDSRHSRSRLLSKQNHVVFGRRGAGKTTLVTSMKESTDHIDIYLNLEDYKPAFPKIITRQEAQHPSSYKDRFDFWSSPRHVKLVPVVRNIR